MTDEDRSMTANKGLKRRVRARATKTGESYASALQHVRNASDEDLRRPPAPMRIAVGHMDPPTDPADRAALIHAGHVIRSMMTQAREQGAALAHFGEGAV
jgi:hypothetical protein